MVTFQLPVCRARAQSPWLFFHFDRLRRYRIDDCPPLLVAVSYLFLTSLRVSTCPNNCPELAELLLHDMRL